MFVPKPLAASLNFSTPSAKVVFSSEQILPEDDLNITQTCQRKHARRAKEELMSSLRA